MKTIREFIEEKYPQESDKIPFKYLEIMESYMIEVAGWPRTGRFEDELHALISKYSLESVSDTPGHILAGFMSACLNAFNEAMTLRLEWYKNDTGMVWRSWHDDEIPE